MLQIFGTSHFSLPLQQFIYVHERYTINHHGIGPQVFRTPLAEPRSDIVNIMFQNGDVFPPFFLPSARFEMIVYVGCYTYIYVFIPLKKAQGDQYAAAHDDVATFRQIKFVDFLEDIHTSNHTKSGVRNETHGYHKGFELSLQMRNRDKNKKPKHIAWLLICNYFMAGEMVPSPNI